MLQLGLFAQIILCCISPFHAAESIPCSTESEIHAEHGVFGFTGGGSSHGQRREGELDGIDQDFDETQIEIQFAGKLLATCTLLPPVA